VRLPFRREFVKLTQIKSRANQAHAFAYELFSEYRGFKKRATVRHSSRAMRVLARPLLRNEVPADALISASKLLCFL
jgi:hypothetical protein